MIGHPRRGERVIRVRVRWDEGEMRIRVRVGLDWVGLD